VDVELDGSSEEVVHPRKDPVEEEGSLLDEDRGYVCEEWVVHVSLEVDHPNTILEQRWVLRIYSQEEDDERLDDEKNGLMVRRPPQRIQAQGRTRPP